MMVAEGFMDVADGRAMNQESPQTVGGPIRRKPLTRVGTVVSDKGDKTIKVEHRFTVKHPRYGKYVQRRTTLHAHDVKNEAKVGDVVEVVACRRISRTKCWRLARVLNSVGGEAGEQQAG
jgi:small subunit ribosomal protein S17